MWRYDFDLLIDKEMIDKITWQSCLVPNHDSLTSSQVAPNRGKRSRDSLTVREKFLPMSQNRVRDTPKTTPSFDDNREKSDFAHSQILRHHHRRGRSSRSLGYCLQVS